MKNKAAPSSADQEVRLGSMSSSKQSAQPAPLRASGQLLRRRSSARSIEANRKNAQLSTGPRTDRGRRIASRNALVHGLLTKEVLIASGYGAESEPELAHLLADLFDEFQPEGPFELLLVQQIACFYWRLKRLYRYETEEIRERLELRRRGCRTKQEAQEMNTIDVSRKFKEVVHTLLARERIQLQSELDLDWGCGENPEPESGDELDPYAEIELERPFIRFVEATRHVKYKIRVLQLAWRIASQTGYLTDDIHKALRGHFVRGEKIVSLSLKAKEACKRKEDREVAEQCRKELLGLIMRELGRARASFLIFHKLDEYLANCPPRPVPVELPDKPSMEHITRYEAHLLRQLYRAVDQLERQQRKRQGELVPPPVTAHLSIAN